MVWKVCSAAYKFKLELILMIQWTAFLMWCDVWGSWCDTMCEVLYVIYDVWGSWCDTMYAVLDVIRCVRLWCDRSLRYVGFLMRYDACGSWRDTMYEVLYVIRCMRFLTWYDVPGFWYEATCCVVDVMWCATGKENCTEAEAGSGRCQEV